MASAKKLPSGSWRVNLYIGKDAEGKRQYKSFTADTKKEAEFLAAQYNQLKIDINRSELPLKKAVEDYIKSKENVLSPSTIRGYNILLNNMPEKLAVMKVRDVTPSAIQVIFNEYALNHSPKTCRNMHGLISVVLKIHRPELTLNTSLPQRSRKEIYVPDEQEIKDIYEHTIGTELEIPFLLATQCGLRASEIAALTRSNVKDGFITIEQAAVRGTDGTEHFKKPKSYAGYRQVPITAELQEMLLEQCTDNRVCILTSSHICNRWVKFRTRYDINKSLNFHALRHHFASKCLLLGIPQKYIAEMMGHSSLDMIEKVYQHTFPSAMEQYAELVRNSSKAIMQHEMQHKQD